MRDWSADAHGRRGRRAAAARRRPLASRDPGRRAAIDSRALAPGELFVGLPGERATAARFAAAGARRRRLGRARSRPAAQPPRAARARGRGARAPTTRSRPAGAGPRVAARARRARSSRSPARPARPRRRTSSPRCSRRACARSPAGEPQHRDRPAAGDPRGAGRTPRRSCSRWRCAAAGRSPS